MDNEDPTVILFEGIASVDVEGVARDVYLTAKVQGVGRIVRWYGHFEWMGDTPKDFKPGGFFDLSLSDGREARIRIPHLSDSETGRLDFLGHGLPPGFEWFQETVVSEINSTTPSQVPNVVAFFLALISCVLFIQGIWADEDSLRYFASGLLLSFVALCFTAYAGVRKGKALPPVGEDD